MACRAARFPETGKSTIGGVAQHRPDHRALPARPGLARSHALVIEPPRNRPDAPARRRIVRIDLPHHARLGINDGIRRGRVLTLAQVAVAVGGATQHTHFPSASPMSLAAARAFEDLGTLVLGDHALKLHEELIFGRGALRRIEKTGGHTLASELLDQQDLVGILAAQTIGRVDEYGCESALRPPGRARAPGPVVRASRRYSRRLRRSRRSAPPDRGSSPTRSAPSSGSRSCAPRAAAPTRPGRKSRPSACRRSLTGASSGRARAGTRIS